MFAWAAAAMKQHNISSKCQRDLTQHPQPKIWLQYISNIQWFYTCIDCKQISCIIEQIWFNLRESSRNWLIYTLFLAGDSLPIVDGCEILHQLVTISWDREIYPAFSRVQRCQAGRCGSRGAKLPGEGDGEVERFAIESTHFQGY